MKNPNPTNVIKIKVRRGLYWDALYRFTRNKLAIIGTVVVILIFFLAIFADDGIIAWAFGRDPQPVLAKTPYDKIFYGPSGAFPTITLDGKAPFLHLGKFWMGTDLNGRDLYSRIVFGTRTSLTVGILAQLVAFSIGIPLGAVAGWKGGKMDFAIMRLVDIMSALPTLLFAYLIMARLGAGFWNVMLAIGVTSWIVVCRLTRGQFLSLREKEYVLASRMIGAKDERIMRVHMIPNALGAIIVALTLGIPSAIFAEASLSFLGVGINPPMPSWGQMLGRDGIANINFYWHMAFFPALMIAITMTGFTLMGDGLRDALDPSSMGGK